MRAVYVPGASADASTEYEPPAERDALTDCTWVPLTLDPEKTRTVTKDESPVSAPADPANVGVASVDGVATALNDTTGAVTSAVPVIVNVNAALRPTFPAASDCSVRAVYVPGASADASTEYEPPAEREALTDCTNVPLTVEPENTRTVTKDESPVSVPADPANVGVVSADGVATALNDTTGAVTSLEPVIVNVTGELKPTFPAASDCSARAVYVPAASGVALSMYQAPYREPVTDCTRVPFTLEPENTRTVTDDESPARSPGTPLKYGAESEMELPSPARSARPPAPSHRPHWRS